MVVPVQILKGACKRVLAGMPVLMTEATGPGRIAFSRDGVGQVFPYGNVFEVVLQPGEQIDIEPGGWIYKDRAVKMETIFDRLATGLFANAGGQLFWNRFTGPGRIALQSMYIHLPTE